MQTGVHILGLMVLVLLGTACQQAPIDGDLAAKDAPERIPALVEAAGNASDAELAELIHALLDDDAAVRLFAIQSLHERTGETLGYRYYAPAHERSAAAGRWRDWLENDRATPSNGPQQARADNNTPPESSTNRPATHD